MLDQVSHPGAPSCFLIVLWETMQYQAFFPGAITLMSHSALLRNGEKEILRGTGIFTSLSLYVSVFLFLNVYLFLRDRERKSTNGGGAERERERDRIPSRLHAIGTEPDSGLELTNREIVT